MGTNQRGQETVTTNVSTQTTNPAVEVRQLTKEAMLVLQTQAKEHPELWRDPDTNWHEVLTREIGGAYDEPTPVTMKTGFQPKVRPGESAHFSDEQGLDFLDDMEGLTEAIMATPGILAWLNHFHLHAYGIDRWPPDKNANMSQHVINHWLGEKDRNIYERSNSGRLLWLAHISRQAAKESGGAFTAIEALKQFSEHAESYHRFMQRPFMRNPRITAAYVQTLLGEGKGLNNRGVWQLIRQINLEAGARLIDTLPQEEIQEMFRINTTELRKDKRNVTGRQHLVGHHPLVALSLGAGAQSSCLALMAEQGYGGLEKPDLAIFADTGWEPPAVYEHLAWLETQLSYKVIRVSAGSIKDDLLAGKTPDGYDFLNIPVHLTGLDGERGMAKRQCTSDYKLKPIKAHLRQELGLETGRIAPKDKSVEMWLGISRDEVSRKKESREKWIDHRFPLIDQDLGRAQLINWFNQNYPDRELPRSACIGCPYHNNAEWKEMKEKDPKSFQEAVQVDWALRAIPNLQKLTKGEAFLHSSRQPLSDVDLSESKTYTESMQEECEGLCGI